jgi:NAD(P)H-hydrate repair Nnr-like enzyme with NAD(P)H-hydrate dehydratase domain
VSLVVDAGAMCGLGDDAALLESMGSRAVLTPNPGEMAGLLGRDLDVVRDDLRSALEDAIERTGVVVALRDAETWIGAPGTERFRDRSGHPALGTSGSGDVLVGFLAGLLARGTPALDATLWAVHCHGVAGAAAAARVAGNGLLAREVLDALPLALATLNA